MKCAFTVCVSQSQVVFWARYTARTPRVVFLEKSGAVAPGTTHHHRLPARVERQIRRHVIHAPVQHLRNSKGVSTRECGPAARARRPAVGHARMLRNLFQRDSSWPGAVQACGERPSTQSGRRRKAQRRFSPPHQPARSTQLPAKHSVPARSPCVFVSLIQSICEKPLSRVILFLPGAACVPAADTPTLAAAPRPASTAGPAAVNVARAIRLPNASSVMQCCEVAHGNDSQPALDSSSSAEATSYVS